MKKIFFLILFSFNFSFAQNVNHLNLDSVIQKSLNYISDQQKKAPDGLYATGEWPVEMKSYLIPAVLGVGKLFARPTEDSTVFATSSIINLLSESYLEKPTLTSVNILIKNGLNTVSDYQDGKVFNFYNLVPYKNSEVRGPVAKGYVPKFIQGLTNIPNDADTTSTTYTAKAFYDLISNNNQTSNYIVPDEVLKTFSAYRDENRKSHYYNWLDSIRHSGAFLTWFKEERNTSIIKNLFASPASGTRIPFGVNDVDCIVNANVLRLLTLTNNKIDGYEKSCELLNFVILKEKQNQCGIYYPNALAVFFSISNVYKAGASCLESSKSKALDYLISNQAEDGSWSNEPGIGRTDQVQTTALALNALINYTATSSESELVNYKNPIQRAARFLLQKMKIKNDEQVYWKGEVFFSAIAQARNTVLWRSDSYTTALVMLSLVKAQKVLGVDTL